MSDDSLFPGQVQDSAQCPGCGATDTRKHGKHLGKQRYYCKRCGLAFTGSAYHYRPAQEMAALRQENRRLLKIAEAAGRLNAAVNAYLKTNSGKSLSNLKTKKERLVRLLTTGPPLDLNILKDKKKTSSATENQPEETRPDLFDAC